MHGCSSRQRVHRGAAAAAASADAVISPIWGSLQVVTEKISQTEKRISLNNIILCVWTLSPFTSNLGVRQRPLCFSREGIKMTKEIRKQISHNGLCLVKWTQSQQLLPVSPWPEDTKSRYSLNCVGFQRPGWCQVWEGSRRDSTSGSAVSDMAQVGKSRTKSFLTSLSASLSTKEKRSCKWNFH